MEVMNMKKNKIWVGIVFGVLLMYEFLISEKWLKSTMHFDEELQQEVFSFSFGFHFTTIIGIVGVVLLVLCVLSLAKNMYSKMLPLALALGFINISCWNVLWGNSELWYECEELNVVLLEMMHRSFQIFSMVLMIVLAGCIVLNEVFQKKLSKLFIPILSLLLIGISIGDLYLSTMNNRWFLFQTIVIVFVTVILFYRKAESKL